MSEYKSLLLTSILKHVPKYGWSDTALKKASLENGFHEDFAALVFPNGVGEVVDLFCKSIDDLMLIRMSADTNIKTVDKIKLALYKYIEILEQYKKVIAKTLSYFALPWNTLLGARCHWRSVDAIWWEVANDKSTDFNYYSKRALLYGVYVSALYYWISDYSPASIDTLNYIERKLNNVLSFGKFITSVRSHFY